MRQGEGVGRCDSVKCLCLRRFVNCGGECFSGNFFAIMRGMDQMKNHLEDGGFWDMHWIVNESLPISVAIVTLNEETNLPRCLASLQGLAREIVVVDAGSTDGTLAVAQSHGARILHQDWLGFREQKQLAFNHCVQPWVLVLDSDEELSAELRREILAFFADGSAEAYHGASFPRMVFFMGRWIRHGDWYPDRKLRLVRRELTRYTGSSAHDKLEMDAGCRALAMNGDLHHYSFKNTNHYISKINVFSDAHLRDQLEAGRGWSLVATLTRPWWRFFRAYVLRRGFLDGFPGLWIAVGTAYQTFIRHSRLYEWRLQQAGTPPDSK